MLQMFSCEFFDAKNYMLESSEYTAHHFLIKYTFAFLPMTIWLAAMR